MSGGDPGEQLLFDRTPVEVGGFKMGARSAEAVGRPTLRQWQTALEFVCATHEASPYWIGDLMAYSESRDDWREKLSQAMAVTQLAEQTLKNLGYISRRVETHERQIAPTPGHASEVASLERPDQTKWLTKARDEGWTVRELRGEIKHAARRTVLEGEAEGIWTVEVSVRVTLEAGNPHTAEDRARTAVKLALANRSPDAKPQIASAKVVGARSIGR